MPYQPAAGITRAMRGEWAPAAYRRSDISSLARQRFWRSLGISADIAGKMTALQVTDDDARWAAQTLTLSALRTLFSADRVTQARDITALRVLTGTEPRPVRWWAGRTGFTVAQIMLLHPLGVEPVPAWQWQQRLTVWHRHTVTLPTVLRTALVGHHVDADDLAGWVRFAADQQVVYRPHDDGSWVFLGGQTALFTRAGVRPDEAGRMVGEGRVDEVALRVMAALNNR